MKSIIAFLKSESCQLVFFLAVLAASTPHAAAVMERVSRYGNLTAWNIGLLYAIIIESSVLLFTVNGKERAGKIYAAASLITNIIFFHRWEELLNLSSYSSSQQVSSVITDLVSSLVISGMLSGSIWYFAELFKEKLDLAEQKLKRADAELTIADKEQKVAKAELNLNKWELNLQSEKQVLEKLKADFELRKGQVFECNECHQHYASEKALHGHMRAHKEKDVVTL